MKYTLDITNGIYTFTPDVIVPPVTDIYIFDKNEWDIVEGVVSYEVALNNRVKINEAITYANDNGFSIFSINNIDAYFEVGALHFGNLTHREGIQIPSNFHFKMGDNCTLRVQPNNNISYGLLSARGVDNVKISGGHLIGDKYEHIYVTGTEQDTHEFGTGIYFVGVTNSEIDGVTIDDMTGDSFGIHSTKNRNPDGSEVAGQFYSKNILIKNVTFKGARRNNLSFIDVDGLILEDSVIANAGEGGDYNYQEPRSWKGVLPRCNIDLEATRSFDADGNIKISQIVQNIIIRNNDFSNAWISDINFYTCNNVKVYGNTFTSGLSNLWAQDIEIYNNTLIHDIELPALNIGIYMKEFIRVETGLNENTNYQIYNNVVKGFDVGISVGGDNHNVYDNYVEQSVNTGLSLRSGSNTEFKNNTITSDVINSKGYYSFPSGASVSNIALINETVSAQEFGLLFKKVLGTLRIEGGSFSGFRGLEFRDSGVIVVSGVEYSNLINKNSNVIIE